MFSHAPSRHRLLATLAVVAGATLTGGCWSVGRDYQTPPVTTPAEYAEPVTPGQTPLEGWWSSLNDDHLVSLVARGLERNRDLRLAFARLAEARAEVGIVDAGLGPEINAQGGVQRTGLSRYTYIPFRIPPFTDYQVGFDASWEIDIWGAVRRGREGALANIAAQSWNAADVANTVSAEIVRTWLDLRLTRCRLVVAQAAVASATMQRQVLDDRAHAGLIPGSAVLDADANLARDQAAIPPLVAGANSDLHALGALLAEDPATIAPGEAEAAPLPLLPQMLQVGVPADLLRHRPDVRSAERQLAAATAQVGVAKADLYPRLSLNGSFGFESINRTTLLTRNALTWGFGPAVSWNIIDWGRVHAQMRVADRRVDEAFLVYEQAVLHAEQEVADALSGMAGDQQAIDALDHEAEDARLREQQEETLRSHGLSETTAVTTRQLSRFQIEDALLLARGHQLQELVALAKALGGGWDAERDARRGDAPTAPDQRATGNARTTSDDRSATAPATPAARTTP